MSNRNLFSQFVLVFDVESVGLHGEGFAVAGGIFDLATNTCLHDFKFACDPNNANGSREDREWINKNIPLLTETHESPLEVREAFWKEWIKAYDQYSDMVMAAECGWPVEARFLNACIDDDKKARNWLGPYPLMEISSVMIAAGMDPMAKYERNRSELPAHDPYADARLSARLLGEAIAKLK